VWSRSASERPSQPQHPMMAPRVQSHGFGGIARQLLALRIRFCDLVQQGGRRFGIGADLRQARRGIARGLVLSSTT
jgi:hypothetical protein